MKAKRILTSAVAMLTAVFMLASCGGTASSATSASTSVAASDSATSTTGATSATGEFEPMTIAYAANATAVSYTHLDVYKRQVLDGGATLFLSENFDKVVQMCIRDRTGDIGDCGRERKSAVGSPGQGRLWR